MKLLSFLVCAALMAIVAVQSASLMGQLRGHGLTKRQSEESSSMSMDSSDSSSSNADGVSTGMLGGDEAAQTEYEVLQDGDNVGGTMQSPQSPVQTQPNDITAIPPEGPETNSVATTPMPATTPAAVTTPVDVMTPCFPTQICQTQNLLDVRTGGNPQILSVQYQSAFGALNTAGFGDTIAILLREANGEIARVCGNQFTVISSTVLQVMQARGSGIVDFMFADATTPRQLNNAVVSFTIPNLGSYGDLRLQFTYDQSGSVSSVGNFFRPTGQSNFFPFPLERQVRNMETATTHMIC